MKAVKGIYKNGRIKLAEKPASAGPAEVLVVFPEASDDPWEEILQEAKPRASFVKFIEKCRKEIAQGKAKPLTLDQL